MKTLRPLLALCALAIALLPALSAQNAAPAGEAAEAKAKAEAADLKKAGEWVSELKLADAAKAGRVQALVAAHMGAVREWNNSHPGLKVPGGGLPADKHAAFMDGLRAELAPAQVEVILDKYTIGKVDFTMRGYKAIVPDLTPKEEEVILGFLKQAREEAIDYKNMKQISAVFEIYKTKSEQYLNSNGRNWKQLYKAYTDAIKAKKAAAAQAAGKTP